jgi:acetolactate decarboxylase
MKYYLNCLFLFVAFSAAAQQQASPVLITGAMKNVMWKGQLQGTINLDTIAQREHLYGLGPVEGLRGEIVIIDGKAYKSTVVDADRISVEETFQIKAPFFVRGYVAEWKEQALPSDVKTLKDMEAYLDKLTKGVDEPFVFRLIGTVEKASIHVVNLPQGSTVSSPDEAHRGQVSYSLANTAVEIVGFFSRSHQSVFTHHDTFMHLHLITHDKTKMGHLDSVVFGPGSMKLYMPK